MHQRSRTPKALGAGLAAVLSLGLAAPAALAVPAAPAADTDPVPTLVDGQETATPQLVTGLHEPAPGSPADAARAHLAAHPERYRIDPGQLAEVAAERGADGRSTVRFQQYHGGVPVLGAQYLVHLTGDGAGQRVESVGGKYFTGLTAPTTATVPAAVLRDLALGEIKDPGARAGATVEDHGAVVVPGGAGRLARHFTVRAADPAGGGQAREVYVDANLGVVALVHDSRSSAPAGTTGTGAAKGTATGAAAGAEPATGTAPDFFGRPVKVDIGRLPDGSYQFSDLTRPAAVTTYDAAGEGVGPGLPTDLAVVHAPGPDFPAATGTVGATDAHVNAGIVYDFYRDRLGRDGLDGKAGPIISVVNATAWGEPLANASWDGSKMVYGGGNDKFRPFSVALDVVGHEMTHGVVENTAGLLMAGQTGAMDEALADYFGNAIEVTARGIPMTDPKAGLLGENLCRTGTPEACAGSRRLDNHRTTVDDYLGVPTDVDSGGVHLNSTIFSGALWDIRRTLDPLTADRVVYRALAAYLTPLDDFVAGRNAVLAAGQDLGLSRAQLRTVAGAFDAHGIRAGWQSRIGADSRTLLRGITGTGAPAVAAGRWVMASAERPGATEALYTGPITGGGGPTRLSPEDGRAHGYPATDGTSAAWISLGGQGQDSWKMEVLTRSLAGGPVRTLYSSPSRLPADVRVSGGDIAFRASDPSVNLNRVFLSHDGGPAVPLPLPAGHDVLSVTLKDGVLGWTERWVGDQGTDVYAPTVYSIALGKVTAQYVVPASKAKVGPALLTGGRLVWTETSGDGGRRTSIRSGAVDGSGVTDVVSGDGPNAPSNGTLTASDRAVTYQVGTDEQRGEWSNAALPKLWQVPLAGGTPERVSCNRGGQYRPAAEQGTRVVWVDATAGRSDLVVRDRPAGGC
ncbi:M4 family metallopeptidase [Kitasatospora sp. NPDC005748]|uniref:M4 family metallopeptidase n=1 Tax=Kitasatospora sp. NPDC005748 TaxID=3157063 RepID=UPI00340D82DE